MKKLKTANLFWQTVALGMLAGMRSATAPAIAGHILSHRRSQRLSGSPLAFMQSNLPANVLKLMAVGELVGDKLPGTPNRIKPAGVIFRCLSGSLAGSAVYQARGKNPFAGGMIACVAALASTYGSFFARQNAVKITNIKDPVIGTIEDALVLGAGAALIARG